MLSVKEILETDEIQCVLAFNNIDPVIITLLDKDTIEQHRKAITKNVTNAFLGVKEELEDEDNQ